MRSFLLLCQVVGIDAGVGDGLVGGDERVLAERVHAADLLAVEVRAGVKVLQLGGEGDAHPLRVERLNRGAAADAVKESVPEVVHRFSDGRESAHAGDDDASCNVIHKTE